MTVPVASVAPPRARATPDREEAFRSLFDAELRYVWKTLRRFGVPVHNVEDVAHEVFVTVFRRFDDIDGDRPIRPWLFGIAMRAALADRRRVRHRYEEVGAAPDDLADSTPHAEAMLESKAAWDLVLEALQALEDDRRAVFIMHDLDELPMSDIAKVLSIPTNTAYSRLRLAREDFRAAGRRIRAKRGDL